MRFFTLAWATGEIDEAESDEVIAAYTQHLDELRPTLPVPVRALAGDITLHDARIRRIVHDPRGRELRLELRAGDEQVGYFDADVTYLGAILDTHDVQVLERCARDERCEVWYDEVDTTSDGQHLHRILFSTQEDVEIMYRALALRLVPRADRSVPHFSDRFVEIHHGRAG